MASRPRLLDLFSGAGGAAMGYYRAGFDVVGVDIKPQKNYPFEFHQGDALTYPLQGFDAYHASPPCQRHSAMTKRWGPRQVAGHPDLIERTRARIQRTYKPFDIENVPGAPLLAPIMLCGSMFGLRSGIYELRRHRLFETSFDLSFTPAACCHQGLALPVYGHAGGRSKRDGLQFPGTDAWREGMGIDWMTGNELAQAIPPAYTEYIGKYLLQAVQDGK
jgi:DNA (cytosine-5)-methyltransferase 1